MARRPIKRASNYARGNKTTACKILYFSDSQKYHWTNIPIIILDIINAYDKIPSNRDEDIYIDDDDDSSKKHSDDIWNSLSIRTKNFIRI